MSYLYKKTNFRKIARVEYADSFLKKAIGLMFKRNYDNKALVFN